MEASATPPLCPVCGKPMHSTSAGTWQCQQRKTCLTSELTSADIEMLERNSQKKEGEK